ncbi:MAG: hypothetical protein Q8R55_05140 [Candidatus Taylorbacteria bacterium]|nr:hypothetical protein [Candidatus Taylorbacteria bacterium]
MGPDFASPSHEATDEQGKATNGQASAFAFEPGSISLTTSKLYGLPPSFQPKADPPLAGKLRTGKRPGGD